MRALPLCLALLACSPTDTTFANAKADENLATGAGIFSVNPAEILFTDLVYEGETGPITQSQIFEVANTGDGNLQIYGTSLSNSGDGVFHLDDADTGELIIAPGSSREMDIIATLDHFAEVTGEIRIQTSDGDHLDARIPITARPVGWTGGDTADTAAP